jgi:acyl-coenzyme A thioesterase PaaI-like protein
MEQPNVSAFPATFRDTVGHHPESRMSDAIPPPGFEPLFRTSPFLETVGPLFYRKDPELGLVIGLRIAEKHANARGIAHGGLLLTLADIALGYRTAFAHDPPTGMITASLSADFAGSAKIGEWIEAHVDIQKVGSRLIFANAYLMVDGERIVRASAVFARAAPLT